MDPSHYPVPIYTQAITAHNVFISYPQIIWPINFQVQNHINHTILQEVYKLFNNVRDQGYFQLGKTEMAGHYEIKNNQRGILSLTLSNFATMSSMAHPVDHLTSLTTDVRNGNMYSLKDLFKPNSNYVNVISKLVKEQIKQRQLPVFEEFKRIRPDQDYYIADKALVIYFQRYEIGPRPLGYPMFPLSIYDLQDIINEQGPLATMIT